MNYRRNNHGCTVMHDGETSVIVSAGGLGRLSSQASSSNGNLNSVEILDPSLGQWNMGK